jgi:hypothetical protein
MAGQKYFDVLAMPLVVGPKNAVRIGADPTGVLQTSIKGAAFTPLGGGGTTLPQTLTLADGTTSLAPDGIVERHTSSGTPAAGFGLTNAVELANAVNTLRRAKTEVIKFTNAADTAEVASQTIRLINAGALSDVLTLNPNSGGSLTAGAATLCVNDASGITTIQLTSGGVFCGEIRARTNFDNEHINSVGKHIFYTGLGAASSPFLAIAPAGIGFFGSAVAAKQTVTGSKGANAALASLLTALALHGLVTDSST